MGGGEIYKSLIETQKTFGNKTRTRTTLETQTSPSYCVPCQKAGRYDFMHTLARLSINNHINESETMRGTQYLLNYHQLIKSPAAIEGLTNPLSTLALLRFFEIAG